ncbi:MULTISPECIES: DUF1654 domain-containing protein [unclassified Pseudomonas]|uniref:DUF1654 domain-containing protein n=1 Tax=unclassified Pseudomonas TaxID=196821 RepID=UPI000BA49729|nr:MULTISPECIES: DUF1654 domain-containing protein [unclassified Pseudomonas]
MHRPPPPASSVGNSCELIRRRIQHLTSAPDAQKTQSIVITRSDEESADAWLHILDEIEETDGIRMERFESGAVRIGWRQYCES